MNGGRVGGGGEWVHIILRACMWQYENEEDGGSDGEESEG